MGIRNMAKEITAAQAYQLLARVDPDKRKLLFKVIKAFARASGRKVKDSNGILIEPSMVVYAKGHIGRLRVIKIKDNQVLVEANENRVWVSPEEINIAPVEPAKLAVDVYQHV